MLLCCKEHRRCKVENVQSINIIKMILVVFVAKRQKLYIYTITDNTQQ